MSRTEYRFDGLDAQEQQLSRMIEEEYPAEFRAMVIQIARELQGKVKEKTPHKTGRLQDSWKVGPIVKKGDTYYIEVYTNVEYAEPVEYGHRTRGGRSRSSSSWLICRYSRLLSPLVWSAASTRMLRSV